MMMALPGLALPESSRDTPTVVTAHQDPTYPGTALRPGRAARAGSSPGFPARAGRPIRGFLSSPQIEHETPLHRLHRQPSTLAAPPCPIVSGGCRRAAPDGGGWLQPPPRCRHHSPSWAVGEEGGAVHAGRYRGARSRESSGGRGRAGPGGEGAAMAQPRVLPQSKETLLQSYNKRLKDDVKSIMDNFTEIIKTAKVGLSGPASPPAGVPSVEGRENARKGL